MRTFEQFQSKRQSFRRNVLEDFGGMILLRSTKNGDGRRQGVSCDASSSVSRVI